MSMDINSEPLIRQTVKQFMHANKMHRAAFTRVAGKYGMHRSQHRMLMYICKNEGKASQKQIAEAMDVSPAAITVMLNKLEETGYILRNTSSFDSRVKYIMPTEKAKVLVSESRSYFDSLDKTMLAGFDEKSLKMLCAAFEKMQENMKNLSVEDEGF